MSERITVQDFIDVLTSIVRYNRSNETKPVGFATEEKQRARHSDLGALD